MLPAVALSIAAYVVASLISPWLPRRYVSDFVLRVEELDPAREVEVITQASPNVSARRVDGGPNIAVQCEGRTPLEARERCAASLSRYQDLRSRAAEVAAPDPAGDLTRELASTDSLLVSARSTLAEVERAERATAGDPSPPAEEEATALQQATWQARATELGAIVADLDRGREGDHLYADLTRYPEELRSGPVAPLVNRLAELEDQRRELIVTRSEVNPDVQAVDWEIDQARDELRSILVNHVDSLRSRIAALARANRRVESAPAGSPESARLRQEVRRLEERTRDLTERLDQLAQEPHSAQPPGLTVVSPPTFPLTSMRPHRGLFVLGGALLGLVLGAALSRRHAGTAPVEGEPPSLATVLFVPPVLGSLLAIPDPRPVIRAIPRSTGHTMALVERSRSTEMAPVRHELERVLACLTAPGQAINGGPPLRVVAITSATRGQERTFLACNLALVSAAQGTRTLLVDADADTDGLAGFLSISEPEAGIRQVLAGEAALDEVIVALGRQGSWQLDLLARGSDAGSGNRIVAGSDVAAILRQLAPRYDLVVVDAPAVTTVTLAAWIAEVSDGVLLASASRSLHGIDDLGAADRLVRSGAHVLGAVLRDPVS